MFILMVFIQICINSNSIKIDTIFNEDLLPKLIEYLEYTHVAFLMRLDKSLHFQLDRNWFSRMIQEKKRK